MKKKWIGILVFVILFCACRAGGTELAEGTPAATEADTPQPEETSEHEGLNPYFTCTGTEYGPYPIIPYRQREAETKAFLEEHRELLERAAEELLNGSDVRIIDGEARMCNDEGRYAPVDAATLSESLQALVRLSEETDIWFYVCDPDPVFSEDAAPYFQAEFPRAIDETMYTDPGTLYFVALIYTTAAEEELNGSYRHDVKPLDGNWYIETYFYAY